MDPRQIELNKLAEAIIDFCYASGWEVSEKNTLTAIKYTCHTKFGKIRLKKWHHNGEYNFNILDSSRVKQFIAYAKGIKDNQDRLSF